MKQPDRLYIVLLAFIIMTFSCEKPSLFLQDNPLLTKSPEILSKSAPSDAFLTADDYRVSAKDLESFIHFLNILNDDKEGKVVSVDSISHEGRIACYLINLESGWKIISADKRGPVVLACCSGEGLSLDEMND